MCVSALQIFILNRNTIPVKYSESEELVASLEMADIIDKRLCMWAETVRLCLRNLRPSSAESQTQYPVTPWSQYYPLMLSYPQIRIKSVPTISRH